MDIMVFVTFTDRQTYRHTDTDTQAHGMCTHLRKSVNIGRLMRFVPPRPVTRLAKYSRGSGKTCQYMCISYECECEYTAELTKQWGGGLSAQAKANT